MIILVALALLLRIILALGAVGLIQWFLSKRENKYLGLIIPTIILLFSIVVSLYFVIPAKDKYTITMPDGEEIIYYAEDNEEDILTFATDNNASLYHTFPKESLIIEGILSFILINIMTLITYRIYVVTRKKHNLNKESSKLKIQDL